MKILKLLSDLRSTTKPTKKIELLQPFKNDDLASMFFHYALNPFITFGITNLKKSKKQGKKKLNNGMFSAYIAILSKLKEREWTGNKARTKLENFISQFNKDSQDLMLCILKKDLKAGIGASTVNKVIRDKIPEFKTQKGKAIEVGVEKDPKVYKKKLKKELKKLDYPLIGEYKYDGLRCEAIRDNSNVTFVSNNGKELFFPYLINEVLEIIDDGEVLDGEMYHKDGFQKIMTQARREKDRNVKDLKKNAKFMVFDLITKDTLYKDKKLNIPLYHRKRTLRHKFEEYDGVPIVFEKFKVLNNPEEVMKFYSKALKLGFEGIMLKIPNSRYECKKNNNWRKLKPELEMDCKVLKVLPHKKNPKMFGKVLVKQENGVKSKVGGGWSDKLRLKYWKNPNLIIGKVIECKYQELTDDGKMRFARFKRFRPDKG